jgi:hypothetical protein
MSMELAFVSELRLVPGFVRYDLLGSVWVSFLED